MSSKWYPVLKVKSKMALPDPDMPAGRFHHSIFVEHEDDGSGTVYHVVGDVTSKRGMSYESKKTENPEELETFHSKELIGYTNSINQWDSVLSALSTPPQQKASNPKKQGKVEPFKDKIGDYEYVFYSPGEERKPLWKCTEWVEWYAIPTLWQHGLFQHECVRVMTTDD
ncbi:hypothetical protein NW752_010880 [Fusarium irregulare]|uniref:Uncharacterized protein n=1 Tax=Fusarium irregulare TaxID=2494466 RepID=A0A9W8PEN9_9HYPO|nr:hypothetical protein NW766_011895 [Fusarium irregulare]KAJ4006232.1 hypothetical protein NW752_010880 [Fusarium irregulare]